MKIYLANYLYDRGVIGPELTDQLNDIEYYLTKKNFIAKSQEYYELLFNEKPDPIVFTGHKFFLTKKPHPLFARVDLMERGLHLFRMMFSRHAHNLRNIGGDGYPLAAPPYLKGVGEYEKKGVMVFENFFDSDEAEKFRKFIYAQPKSENIQSFNKITNIMSPELYDIVKYKIYPICAKAVHRQTTSTPAWEHFQATSYVQRLDNSPNNGDIQKVCHSDVFYPCLKYWYFPQDVTTGTFMYAKGSTMLDEEQLDFYLRESIAVTNDTWDRKRNKGHGEGSFRALPEDLKSMGLKLEPVTVKANSLVIADTSGFHCRGDVERSSTRNALHGAIRVETPFDT